MTLDDKAVLVKTFRISPCDLGTKDRSECTVRVRYIDLKTSLLPLLKRRKKLLRQYLLIQRFLQFEIIGLLRIKDQAFLLFCVWIIQDAGQIQCRRTV